jgi:PAS domain S-box-containing protein
MGEVPLGAEADMGPIERLRRSEELYARAFNQNPVAMTITHGETQRFTAVNDAFLTLFGYWRSDVIGKNSLELGLWPDRSDRERVGERLAQEGLTPFGRATIRTKTGTHVPCLVAHRLLRMSEGVSVLSVLVPMPQGEGSG